MKKTLNKYIAALAMLIAGVTAVSCGSDLYGEMPDKVQQFVSMYYPNAKVAQYTLTDSTYTVVISNGPTITFDGKYNWTSINGNGSTVPQQFLFDQLPQPLYGYLQETEDLGRVFSVSRNSKTYTVLLLKYKVYYDIAKGEVTGRQPLVN